MEPVMTPLACILVEEPHAVLAKPLILLRTGVNTALVARDALVVSAAINTAMPHLTILLVLFASVTYPLTLVLRIHHRWLAHDELVAACSTATRVGNIDAAGHGTWSTACSASSEPQMVPDAGRLWAPTDLIGRVFLQIEVIYADRTIISQFRERQLCQ